MKIVCPGCKRNFEIEHVERGRKVECQCSCKFLLDEQTVLEDYSSVDEKPPRKIGPCEIERFIGRGGMGKVYKGRHPALGIPVAVKTLLPEYASDRSFKVRFIKSAKICAQVDHPNIVRIYDCGEDDGSVYLILEYIGGGSVQRMIERHGPVPLERICEIGIAVCRGLAEAARHGIVHRDIKPENIMRSRDGEYKLSDLGLAKQRSDELRKLDPSLTVAFVSLGTPHYMPPEQAIDARSCDVRADIYALGVSFYEMATGKLPFDAKDPAELRRLHNDVEPAPPSSLRAGLNLDLQRIIMRCLRKRREERYQTPEALLEELLALKEGRPLPSTLEAGRLAREKAKRKALKAAVIAAAAFMLVLALLYLFWPRQPNYESRGGHWTSAGEPAPSGSPAAAKASALKNELARAQADDPVVSRRRELWKYAVSLADKALQSGEAFDAAIVNLRAFTEDEDAKELAAEAAKRIEALSSAKAAAIARLMDTLASQARPFSDAQNFSQAAEAYSSYSGKLAKETAAQRENIAASLRESARKLEERRRAESEASSLFSQELLSSAASLLLEGKTHEALSLASAPAALKALPELKALLLELDSAPSRILDSFARQAGMQIYLSLDGAKASFLNIRKVENGQVFADETSERATIAIRFKISSLDLPERLARLSGSAELSALYAGLELFSLGRESEALASFKRAQLLGPALADKLQRRLASKADDEAKAALLAILSSCSFKVKSLPEPDEFPGLAAWVSLSPENSFKTASALSAFLGRFASTASGQRYASALKTVIAGLEAKAAASVLPAEAQASSAKASASRKLPSPAELDRDIVLSNISYSGGAAIELLRGRSGYSIDISGLPIGSIESLRGLPVRTLVANNSHVSSLEPLAGAPLENLQIAGSKVTSLKPLNGIKLKCIAFSPDMLADKAELDILRNMKSLETVGLLEKDTLTFVPAREFWRSLDSKESSR